MRSCPDRRLAYRRITDDHDGMRGSGGKLQASLVTLSIATITGIGLTLEMRRPGNPPLGLGLLAAVAGILAWIAMNRVCDQITGCRASEVAPGEPGTRTPTGAARPQELIPVGVHPVGTANA